MPRFFVVIATTWAAGLTMAVGALLARYTKLRKRWVEEEFRHSITAFGGGALLSAVALVLVPHGIGSFRPLPACLWFIGGGASFMLLDIFLAKTGTPAGQLAAMLSDFIPESIALGASFAAGSKSSYLLAALIALQNLPEGFSAYSEMRAASSYKPSRIIVTFFLMATLGPMAGISGYFWLSAYPTVVAATMLFASGGILYAVFQDLAPHVHLEQHWAPPMGAVLGFVLGLYGLMITA